MDSFEQIRRAAAGLHTSVVLAGADECDPVALVESAIQHLDLELVFVAPSDPVLKGALALFDQQSGMICCSDGEKPDDRPLLIAHEIAHAYLHSDSVVCAEDAIDLNQPADQSPVGFQRVEDYGPHERRELQANVFAREFLFPRDLGRRLYIEETISAEAISTRTGLPRGLVCQQLLDSLLLRSETSQGPNRPNPEPKPPDLSQEDASKHRGTPFLLQAGPGTGKTHTLINRVLSLIREGVDPSSILILTFSNRAAGELVERIGAAAPETAPRIWVGTFHAFGLDLIRRYHDKFGLSSNPILFDRSDAIEVLEEILPTLPLVHYQNLWDPLMVLRDVTSAISRAKDELCGPSRYRDLANAMLAESTNAEERDSAEKCLEVAQVFDLYEQALRERDAVDFGDLVLRPAILLETDPDVRTEVQLRHRHILVDEYQDVNQASVRLLTGLAGDGNRLWVVGDARQSIYRFRGASTDNISGFQGLFPGATTKQLSTNYRSKEFIVQALMAVAPYMGASKGMLKLDFASIHGKNGGRIECRRFDSPDAELAGIASSIMDLVKAGVPFHKQAVLCRSNGKLNEVAEYLEDAGIPVLHLGSLFERDEVRDLLSILSLAVGLFADGLVRVAAMPRYDLSLQDTYEVIRYLRGVRDPKERSLLSASKLPEISEQGARALRLLDMDLEGFSASTSPWELLTTYLLDRSDSLRELYGKDSPKSQMQGIAIWQFLNFARANPTGSPGIPIRKLLERVRQLVLLAEERDLRQVPASSLHMDAVRLMTVHGSKGLEFDTVHLPGLTVSSFPAANRGDRCPPPKGMVLESLEQRKSAGETSPHDLEEESLFFVALSRARDCVRLYLSQFQSNGNKRSPSPFLGWIPAQLLTDVMVSGSATQVGSRRSGAPVHVMRRSEWCITDSHLLSYERCPRRFFYTHVLTVGGSKKASAFTQTHECIYSLIRWIRENRQRVDLTPVEIELAFESIWQVTGPKGHPFETGYLQIARRFLRSLVQAGSGYQFLESESLVVDFLGAGRVVVEPNEIAKSPDGIVVLRRVRTGKKRSGEYDRLDYTLYQLAGQARYGPSSKVEALHLADGEIEAVEVSSKKVSNRRSKIEAMLKEISAGSFPAEADPVTCSRCPHFFICSATPKGSLQCE